MSIKIFAIVIKSINYKIIFIFIVVNNWNLEQINIVIVLFYKNINKEIYIKLLYNFKQSKKIC